MSWHTYTQARVVFQGNKLSLRSRSKSNHTESNQEHKNIVSQDDLIRHILRVLETRVPHHPTVLVQQIEQPLSCARNLSFHSKHMSKDRGGLSASYLGVSESTIQWVLYEQFKRTQDPCEKLSWFQTISSAGSAKLIATIITYPHEVIRTRLRQQPEEGGRKYQSLIQTFRLVLKEEGALAFYGGLSAHLMRVIPNAIVTFSIYEFVLMLGSGWK